MDFPSLHQIKWKLTLVILGTSVVVLILGVIAVLVYDSVTSKRYLLEQVNTMAEITAANSSAAMAFLVTRDAQETLAPLRERSEIDLACLYLKDDQPFVFFATNGVTLDSVAQRIQQEEGHMFDGERLILKRKVLFGDDPIGSIIISANLRKQTARSHAFVAIALLSVASLIGVALFLATRLQRLVSDPITHLAKTANYVTTHRDYRVRVESNSNDEIGSLVSAFNEMLFQIERQNLSLVESENRLKLALSASQMGTWEWNSQTDTVSWSDKLNRILGGSDEGIDFSAFAKRLHPEDTERVSVALRRSVEDQIPFATEYQVITPVGELKWVAHHGQPHCDSTGSPVVLAGIVQDISDRKQAEADHQKLVASLLHAEEDERRRIARELHDTTAQHLAVLKLNFTRLCELQGEPADPQLATDSFRLLDQALQEIRTLTYLLHPPLLEQFGLEGALKDFASGISRRNEIKIVVHSDDYEGRLSPTIELTLFRVIQESVTNAIRHSGTKEILIRLARDAQDARVEVQDFGSGFPTCSESSRRAGVGISSMHERLALVGGTLSVESDPEGVTVQASVPVASASPPTPPEENTP